MREPGAEKPVEKQERSPSLVSLGLPAGQTEGDSRSSWEPATVPLTMGTGSRGDARESSLLICLLDS